MRWWPRLRRRPTPTRPVRETLPWHDEGVAGDFKRAACAVMLEVVANREISTEQARALLDTHAQYVLGLGCGAFAARWDAGLLDEGAPGVASCAALLRYSRRAGASRLWTEDWDSPEDAVYDVPDEVPEVLARAARRPRRFVREGDS